MRESNEHPSLFSARSGIRVLAGDAFTSAVIALTIILVVVATLRVRQRVSYTKAPNIVEIQSLTVESVHPSTLSYFVQPTIDFKGGAWQNDNHVIVQATVPGSVIRYQMKLDRMDRFRLTAFLSKSYDYGIVQVSVDGIALGAPIDLWSNSILPTGPIDLGEVKPGQGRIVLEFKVIDKNKFSREPFYQFGIDGLKVEYL